jgi:H+/gluconate symporter-like permease
MQLMKKLFTLLFIAAVAFSLAMPVFAQDTSSQDTTKTEKPKKEKKTKAKKEKKTKASDTSKMSQ